MGSLLNRKGKNNSIPKKVKDITVSHRVIVTHKAKVLSGAEVKANRSNAYSYLPL